MTEQFIIDLGREALLVTLKVAGPMLAAALLIGLVVSIFQAVTQINEMTMTFVPKIIGILLTGVLVLPWVLGVMVAFSRRLFGLIGTM
ncbi:MAG: flagellar biosynthesis protein FliQ [Candidatus Krumholzibacteria bacterium]|jgi:flagellar biosynthetic protein FliQ|nr:flagellar biosynthesis protein FliQ [Candidatus Krumholzibacteria bacterium]MDP6669212.1 flagellar biosynthesis protein FliQ [Candidatus Krumholzibacteria bacterium]MDP6797084.1 flagellar biosynthesis protein FliQ [Candidatus Krumholzibacteria bacterium]MDP7020940.1 flagellar biosynthesis protein FliQ [Candidatus Krumholzibacteria bacterium]